MLKSNKFPTPQSCILPVYYVISQRCKVDIWNRFVKKVPPISRVRNRIPPDLAPSRIGKKNYIIVVCCSIGLYRKNDRVTIAGIVVCENSQQKT